jgi:hypothetical protein
MTIEEDVEKRIKKFAFFNNLPEFIDRAKFLEGRLKKGKSLLIGVSKRELKGSSDSLDYIYFGVYTEEKFIEAITLDCLGRMAYNADFFKDYKPLKK